MNIRPRHATTLTLITNLLTNRLNNKYIFRPRSVVSGKDMYVGWAVKSVNGGVWIAREDTDYTHTLTLT